MAHLRLTDAVDAPEALFQAVGIPGQVVVDHEMGALQVDAFPSGIGSDQDKHLFVLHEALLDGAPLLTAQAAMDGHDCVRLAE